MTSKYATNEKKPSKMFVRAINSGSGSSSVHCSCGRQHYAPGNVYDSDDEDDYQAMLDDALAEQKKDPDGVIINYEDDFIYAKEIDGKTFVVDCPCNGLRKYEDWMWSNRETFRDYLKIRIENEAKWAEAEVLKNKLAGIV